MSDDIPEERLSVPVGTPRFQISLDDLETLERALPVLMDAAAFQTPWGTPERVVWGKVQKIVSNIRWNYGPPLQVERVD